MSTNNFITCGHDELIMNQGSLRIPLDARGETSLMLCPHCAQLVRGAVLTEIMQTAAQQVMVDKDHARH